MTSLPDWDDLFALAKYVAILTRKKAILVHAIEIKEAEIIQDYETKYIKMSLSSIKSAVPLNKDLQDLKNQLADIVGEIEEGKMKFQILMAKIDVWKTENFTKNVN